MKAVETTSVVRLNTNPNSAPTATPASVAPTRRGPLDPGRVGRVHRADREPPGEAADEPTDGNDREGEPGVRQEAADCGADRDRRAGEDQPVDRDQSGEVRRGEVARTGADEDPGQRNGVDGETAAPTNARSSPATTSPAVSGVSMSPRGDPSDLKVAGLDDGDAGPSVGRAHRPRRPACRSTYRV